MKKKMLNLLARLQSLFEFINTNKEKLISSPSGKEILDMVWDKYDELNRLLPNLRLSTKELSAQTEKLKLRLCEAAGLIAGCLKSYNLRHKDSAFRKFEPLSKSGYLHLKTQELINEMSSLVELLQTNEASALAAGLKAEMLSEISEFLTDYKENTQAIKNIQEQVRLDRDRVEDLIEELNDWLEIHFFNFMEREYKVNEFKFYSIFLQLTKKARIVNYKRALIGEFIDANTKAPLHSVRISIDGEKARKHGGKKGNYFIQYLSEGIHNISFSLPGYQPQEHKINIIQGETSVLNIELVPELVGVS